MNATPSIPDIKAAVPDMVRRLMAVLAPLAQVVAAEFMHRPGLVALMQPLWLRLMHVGKRFAAVRLVPTARKSRAGEVRAAPLERVPRARLTGKRGWLIKELGYKAAPYRAQLADLLAQPEMRAVLDAAPGFGRVLRPVCWMLGISRDKASATVVADGARAPARRKAERARPAKVAPVVVPPPPVEPMERMTSGLAWAFAKIR